MKLSDYLAKHGITQSAFAESLEVSQGLVHQWLSGKRPIAAPWCPIIERFTNGDVRCEELNSDVDWAYVRETGALAALSQQALQISV